jgi:L-ascorbate metabolism protein UlaG (beta-lactamase superfamily)
MNQVYLKPTIQIEPLFCKWYAWPYLIPPHTASKNIVERHLKIMSSYLQNPKIHAQAVKNPAMVGGPFLDLPEEKAYEIKKLIEFTQESCQSMIDLNNALKEANEIIQSQAKGYSVEELYHLMPDILKGKIEIVYDLNNFPSLRIIEGFFYHYFYSENHQEVALSDCKSDFKKFILSSPVVNKENTIYLKIPFSDKRLDWLLNTKNQPCFLNEAIELLKIEENEKELFKSFFTLTPNAKKLNRNYYSGEGVRIRYFGHACVLLETKDISILLDPAVSYPIDNELQRYSFDDLPAKIDYVLITHNHTDHLMFETLLQLRHKIGKIVFPKNQPGSLADPSIKLILKHTGFDSLLEVDELEVINLLHGGKIIALPFLGEHCDLNIHTKLSYCINLGDKKIMFAADSNNLDPTLYDNIYDLVGNIDVLFIGMECEGAPLSWMYGPLIDLPLLRQMDQSRRQSGSNCKKALLVVEKTRCTQAYVYAMGQEPWLSHVMGLNYSPESKQIIESNMFIEACKSKGITSGRPYLKEEWELK